MAEFKPSLRSSLSFLHRSIGVIVVSGPGGVLDFGLDGGVPPGPRDPNPCLELKNVPMFTDFAPKMDPCLGILLQKQAIFFLNFQKIFKKWTPV